MWPMLWAWFWLRFFFAHVGGIVRRCDGVVIGSLEDIMIEW
jgi:hypothetical protein